MTNDHQTTQSHLDSQELLYVLIPRQITELEGQDSLSGGPCDWFLEAHLNNAGDLNSPHFSALLHYPKLRRFSSFFAIGGPCK